MPKSKSKSPRNAKAKTAAKPPLDGDVFERIPRPDEKPWAK